MGENFIVPGLRPGLIYDALSGHDIIWMQRQEARKIRAQGNALGKG